MPGGETSLASVRQQIELVERLEGSLDGLAGVLGCDPAALHALAKLDAKEAERLDELVARLAARAAR
jgi:hypothetical protein